MRQTDFKIGAVRRRLYRSRLAFYTSLSTDVVPVFKYRTYRRYKHSQRDLRKIQIRSFQISSASFNLNAYSDLDAMTQFRFLSKEIAFVAEIIGGMEG